MKPYISSLLVILIATILTFVIGKSLIYLNEIKIERDEAYCKKQIKVRDMSYLPAICYKYLKDFD